MLPAVPKEVAKLKTEETALRILPFHFLSCQRDQSRFWRLCILSEIKAFSRSEENPKHLNRSISSPRLSKVWTCWDQCRCRERWNPRGRTELYLLTLSLSIWTFWFLSPGTHGDTARGHLVLFFSTHVHNKTGTRERFLWFSMENLNGAVVVNDSPGDGGGRELWWKTAVHTAAGTAVPGSLHLI